MTTSENTAIVNGSNVELNVNAERENIRLLATSGEDWIKAARVMAMRYEAYAMNTGNSELLRFLREALLPKYKTRLDAHVAAATFFKARKVEHEAKGDKPAVSFINYTKSKTVAAQRPKLVESVHQVAFDLWKPAKTAKAFEMVKRLNSVSNRAEKEALGDDDKEIKANPVYLKAKAMLDATIKEIEAYLEEVNAAETQEEAA